MVWQITGMTRRSLVIAASAALALAAAMRASTASSASSPSGFTHRNVALCSGPASGEAAYERFATTPSVLTAS